VAIPSWRENQRRNIVSQVRVLIVDDEEDMRVLVRNLITLANDGLSVAGEASSGAEAVNVWRDVRPEVVLLDQRMPGLSGLDTARAILREDPKQMIVLFSAFMDAEVTSEADELGVHSCVSKRDARQLVADLRTCAA
jgi:DNA-binding NarL/FixJ family response regulator